MLPIDTARPWAEQIPDDVDIAHFQFNPHVELDRPIWSPSTATPASPAIAAQHGVFVAQPRQSLWLGRVRVQRPGLGGLWPGSGFRATTRSRYHFLGKAAWSVKNVRGAIKVAKLAGVELDVLGGDRFQFKRGFRFTFSRQIHFHGMVGGEQKTACSMARAA